MPVDEPRVARAAAGTLRRMHHRPQIKPALRRAWRDDTTLQIGLTPDAGVVVTGLGPLDARLLDHLDGTRRLSDLERWASTQGAGPGRVRALLGLLDEAGVLTGPPTDRAHLYRLGRERRLALRPDALAWSVTYADAGDGFELLARRTRRPVLLIGDGLLASACAAALSRAAVPVEHARSRRERADALAALPERQGPRPDAAPDAAGAYDAGQDRDDAGSSSYPLVLLVDDDAVGTTVGSALVAASQPHLVVLNGADRTTVGPLVRPGRSACVRCVELARTDRDPGWPAVAAQLDAPPAAVRGETSLTHLTAALVALQVACWVDRRRTPATVGATLTLALPEGLPVRRTWSRHARCGCSWLPASVLADA